MTSNKLFRVATLLRLNEPFLRPSQRSFKSVPRFRFNSIRRYSGAQSSRIDLLRVRRDLCVTLSQRLQQLESRRSSAVVNTPLPVAGELAKYEQDTTESPRTPSTSNLLSKDERKLWMLRERFRSRLHTYLQACVLAAFSRSGQNSKNAQRRQLGHYLDAAYGALRHYSDCIENLTAKRFVSLEDAELFNSVLLGWVHGASGIWHVDVRDRCLNLRKVMQKRKVKPNEGTLAAFYLLRNLSADVRCRVHRKGDDYYQSEISRVVDELQRNVRCSGKFVFDPRLNDNDREFLLQLLKPDHKRISALDSSITPTKRYKKDLLKSLNEPYVKGLSGEETITDGPYASVFPNGHYLMADFDLQLEREKRGIVEVPSAVDAHKGKSVYDRISDSIHDYWRQQLLTTFKERKARYTRVSENRMTYGGLDSYKINIAPFLCLLKPESYVDVMFDEAIRLANDSLSQGLPLKMLCGQLGSRLMGKVQIELAEQYGLIDKISDTYKHYLKYFLDWRKCNDVNHREFWLQIAVELHPSNPYSHVDILTCDNDWLLHELGEFLCQIMIDSLKVPASLGDAVHCFRSGSGEIEKVKLVDAFFKAMSSYGVRVYEEIRSHATLASLKKKSVQRVIRFDAAEVPLVCPPIPWHRQGKGQLLLTPVDLVRLEPSGARSLRNTQCIRAEEDDVRPVLDALNVLGSTPWVINRSVLNVMLKIFRGDGDMKLAIPPSQAKLPKITEMPSKKETMNQEERVALMKKRQEERKTHMEIYSLWCTAHYRFSLAEYLKDKILWFPHNVDFRGRTYPVPPILNHMGDDVCRGMMQFAQGRPLGKHGLYWLKVHLINLTGLKKRQSVDERAKYADEIMEEILDSARKPLKGRRWWAKSEDPWQTLAVCMEIEKALKMANSEEYVCNLPIHQDGSCNGLQHYAALGRDQQGAVQVNLEPAGSPQDVYSAVAAKIEEKRANDAAAGLEIAKILDGFVRRKVIKQTVMTTVYGVTRYGGRAQIGRQLKDIEEFPQEHVFQASSYLVERLFESIGEIFSAARHIQDWFVKSSRLISAKLGKTVEWVTPLGFPVAQPYFKCVKACKSFASEDRLSDASSRPFPINYMEVPNTYKQRNAFPPNYIHSLDSTHMMLTALHCHRQGIAYAAVHDSFWTHASAIADMNAICREQFVALHSQPLLHQLSEFFVQHYVEPELVVLRKMKKNRGTEAQLDEMRDIKGHFLSLPQLGKFDLTSVQESRYFFC